MEQEIVNHPDHYNMHRTECIDEMLLIFGKDSVIEFCKLNAWKYRYRSPFKGESEDIQKADWYISKIKELRGY